MSVAQAIGDGQKWVREAETFTWSMPSPGHAPPGLVLPHRRAVRQVRLRQRGGGCRHVPAVAAGGQTGHSAGAGVLGFGGGVGLLTQGCGQRCRLPKDQQCQSVTEP